MITNKDIRVENGYIIINGDKYPLDGQSPETIMQIVEDNSDTTPTENSTAPITSGGVFAADKDITDTIGDITQTGVTGATVAAQIKAVNDTTGDITQTGVTGATVAAQIAALNNDIVVENVSKDNPGTVSAVSYVRYDFNCSKMGYNAVALCEVYYSGDTTLIYCRAQLNTSTQYCSVFFYNPTNSSVTPDSCTIRVIYKKV